MPCQVHLSTLDSINGTGKLQATKMKQQARVAFVTSQVQRGVAYNTKINEG